MNIHESIIIIHHASTVTRGLWFGGFEWGKPAMSLFPPPPPPPTPPTPPKN